MRNLSESETPRPEPGSTELIHLRTERHLETVEQLGTGGMEHADATWYVEMNNMVVKKFHGNPHFAFQDSDPGVLERYLRLDAHARAILSGQPEPEVIVGRTVDNSPEAVRDAVRGVVQPEGSPQTAAEVKATANRITEQVQELRPTG